MAIYPSFFKRWKPRPHKIALRLALIYAVVGGLWILFSDEAVAAFTSDPHKIQKISTAKGWIFILITSFMLYGLVRGYLAKLAKVHQELLDSEDTFSTAFHHSPDCVSISRFDNGCYVDINDGFTHFTGYEHDEAVGKSAYELTIWVNPDDRKKLIAQLAPGHVVRLESQFRAKDGTIKLGSVSATLINVRGQKCLLANIKDITDRQRAELAAQRFTRELADKNKELESIIYVASHDLRSALVNIQGFSRELLMACDSLRAAINSPEIPDHIRESLRSSTELDIPESVNFIVSSTATIDSLLTGLLRLSRLSREPVNIIELDVNSIVADVLKMLEVDLKAAGIVPDVQDLPSCMGDRSQIRQVFYHLIKNAIYYLDKSRHGTISITGCSDDNVSVYCVEDNGIGIALEYQDKIFEIFHRLNPNQSAGEGLGLTIVRRITERHSGKVWVESTPGKGSKFCISYPAID